MKVKEKKRKLCTSWYHKKWFRLILIIIGVDMVMLGFSLVIGLDIAVFLEFMSPVVKIVFGGMYILTALFVIHYAVSYEKIKKQSHFVCHHCLTEHLEKEKTSI